MSLPSMTTEPSEAVSMPPRMLSSVDLPAPDEPRMTTSSPFSHVKLTSLFARISDVPLW